MFNRILLFFGILYFLLSLTFMTAWASEARHSPSLQNEIKKTKLNANTRHKQAETWCWAQVFLDLSPVFNFYL